jgi:hypothetical protein
VRRRAAAAPALAGLAALALLLAGCSNSGLTLARQACTHVETSIRLYTAATNDTDQRQAAAQRKAALEELEAALPLAAQATAADGQWNPLMTTLQEAGRNSEAHLVTALRLQCAQAARTNEQAPTVNHVPGQPTPSTLPGQGQ